MTGDRIVRAQAASMKAQRASRAFDAAIERDCAWFKSNPVETGLCRKVTGRELL